MSDMRKVCPLKDFQRCAGSRCAWWTVHEEMTSDGPQAEELCAIVEISRGMAIDIEVDD